MGRPPQYSRDQLLDAALDLALAHSPAAVTAAGVAEKTGAPSGSVYHRFPSRDHLVTELWLRATEDFLAGWRVALGPSPSVDDCVGAARWIVTWARVHPQAAQLLASYPAEAVLPAKVPQELTERVRRARQQPAERVLAVAETLGRGTEAVAFALLDVPYAALRRSLAEHGAVPAGYETLIERAARAVLA